MKTGIKSRIISALLAMALLFCLGYTACAQKGAEVQIDSEIIGASDNGIALYEDTEKYNAATTDINLAEKNGTKLLSGTSKTFNVNIPSNSNYNFVLLFSPLNESIQHIDYTLKIDGEYPFYEAQNLRADCIYQNDGEITSLSNGDQIAPPLVHIKGVMEAYAYDINGTTLKPFELSLNAGEHTVTVTASGNDVMLYGIRLDTPERHVSYKEYIKEHLGAQKYNGKQLIIEGESAIYKNAYSVGLRSDSESSVISPVNAKCSYINYIGGTTWNEPFQEVFWKINVPKDGLYKIGSVYKQSTIINGYVYRSLKIDGKLPFEEAGGIEFAYTTNWDFGSFASTKGEEYLFYLTEGEHTLSLAVTLDNVAEVYLRLKDIVEMIGDTYLDMVMITGEAPDTNRDYELYKQIPEFADNIKKYKKLIDALSVDVKEKYRVNGEFDGALKNMSRILGEMSKSQYNAHLYITAYYSYYQTLTSWLYDIKNMSLSLDKLIIAAPDVEFDTGKPDIFSRFAFSLTRFLYSFVGDYSTVSIDDDDAKTLKLWVNWGRDQVKVLNSLIKQSFSAKYGIGVRVEQVNASLVQGVVSNNSPDLYLHLSRTEPVNLAMRGVIYDLSSFEDFDEVLTQFAPGAEEPYIYRDGVYALPDTQTFNTLFYRTDILNELGISVPKTWEEFLDAAAVIQRKNMNVYLPYTKITAATTVNTGVGGLSIFPSMLLQKGGSIYNGEFNATALAEPVSVSAFGFWTDFYERFGLDVDTNFYQRFRVGTIPLGVAPYTQCLIFSVAAPEINGKWQIAEMPGFMDENGDISNVCAGGGSGCVIMNSSKNKDAAWEFLKWWVSADVQYEYSTNVEAIIGESGRVATSNIEALSRLSWKKEALDIILSQWEKVKEIREVPGSYYVSRSIDQAFWAVYNGTATPKEAITEWSIISDDEIERKISEYADKSYGEVKVDAEK